MNASLLDLLGLTQLALWHGFAVFLRVGPMVALLPAFGEQSVPVRVKLALSIAMVVIVAPAIATNPFAYGMDTLALLVMTETLSGLILGIGLRLFVLALQTAGAIAAQSTSLSQLLGGAVSEPVPAMAHMLVISALALAVMTGLHVKAAALVILSYDLLPLGTFPDGATLSSWGVAQIVSAFALAFTLSAPFIILSTLYNLVLGAINKAMPQLMVAFVGAPLITAGGLVLLCLAAPMMLRVWLDALDNFLTAPFAAQP